MKEEGKSDVEIGARRNRYITDAIHRKTNSFLAPYGIEIERPTDGTRIESPSADAVRRAR